MAEAPTQTPSAELTLIIDNEAISITQRLRELEKCKRQVTILFTDIKGSTNYFEKRGDAAGLLMLHECNKGQSKAVERHRGKVIKTIGDAVMATFCDCRNAVEAAIEIQNQFYERNKSRAETEQIDVRIGINYGQGMVTSNDVFGDVVNVASRVESVALPKQIVVSATVRDQITGAEFELRPLGKFSLKGKQEEHELFEVVWNKDDPRPITAHTVITPPPMRAEAVKPFLLQHVRPDGTLSAGMALSAVKPLVAGRSEGDLTFPSDQRLAPAHARFSVERGQVFVEHLGGAAGIFLRLTATHMLEEGDLAIIGGQWLRFCENSQALKVAAATGTGIAKLSEMLQSSPAEFVSAFAAPNSPPIRYPLAEEQVIFGRRLGKYVFPSDYLMSGQHARVCHRGENFFLEDLGSKNGTFVKVRGKAAVPVGAAVLISEQVLKVTQ